MLLLFFSVVFVMRLVKHRLCQVFYRIEFKREVLFLRHAGGPADSAQCYLGTQRCYRKVRKRLMENGWAVQPPGGICRLDCQGNVFAAKGFKQLRNKFLKCQHHQNKTGIKLAGSIVAAVLFGLVLQEVFKTQTLDGELVI